MTTLEFKYQLEQAYSSISNYTYKFTTNSEEAGDLLHETILKAMSNKQKFTEGTNIKAWLYTIMRNVFINKYRRETKFNEIINNQPDIYNLYYSMNSTLSPLEKTTYNELQSQINRLSEKQRTPFKQYLKGYKYHEIAENLSIPIGTVKTRIHQARKILASKIIQ